MGISWQYHGNIPAKRIIPRLQWIDLRENRNQKPWFSQPKSQGKHEIWAKICQTPRVLGHFTYKIVILGYPPFSKNPLRIWWLSWKNDEMVGMVGERLVQKMVDFVSVISNDENHRVWDVSSNPRNPKVQVGEFSLKQLISDWVKKSKFLSYPELSTGWHRKNKPLLIKVMWGCISFSDTTICFEVSSGSFWEVPNTFFGEDWSHQKFPGKTCRLFHWSLAQTI